MNPDMVVFAIAIELLSGHNLWQQDADDQYKNFTLSVYVLVYGEAFVMMVKMTQKTYETFWILKFTEYEVVAIRKSSFFCWRTTSLPKNWCFLFVGIYTIILPIPVSQLLIKSILPTSLVNIHHTLIMNPLLTRILQYKFCLRALVQIRLWTVICNLDGCLSVIGRWSEVPGSEIDFDHFL